MSQILTNLLIDLTEWIEKIKETRVTLSFSSFFSFLSNRINDEVVIWEKMAENKS